MMLRICLAVLLVFGLSGCATMQRSATNVSSLEMRVNDLEKRLQEKDDEIRGLEVKLEQARKTTETTSPAKPDVAKVTKKEIQAALKNAGFYNGPIDGKFGRLTAEAVKEFQKANGLKEDGRVGQQTWAKLSQHLE